MELNVDERKAERSNAENAWGGEDMSNELTRNLGQFDEVPNIIDNARSRAMKAVNAELIQMYWEIGSYVSGRITKNSHHW